MSSSSKSTPKQRSKSVTQKTAKSTRSKPAKKSIPRKKQGRRTSIRSLITPLIIVGVIAGFYALMSFMPDFDVFGKAKAYNFREYTCSNQVEDTLETSTELPKFSDQYMNRVAQELNGKTNLVANADLRKISPVTKQPDNFFYSVTDPAVSYQFFDEEGQRVLRVSSSNVPTTRPGWIMNSVPVSKGQTYGFSFDYRSTANSEVTLELTTSNGEITYVGVRSLDPTNTWQKISGHFTIDIAAITARVIVSQNSAGDLDTRSYQLSAITSAQLNEPIISITFDDGWKSIYENARPLLKKYGFTSTQYVISEFSLNKAPEYMTQKQLKKMAAEGSEIGSHSLRHCDLTGLSESDLAYDIENAKSSLEQSGFSAVSFAHPFGRYSEKTTEELASMYTYIRSSDLGFNDRYFDPHNIMVQSVEADTSNEMVASWVQQAKENNAWLVLLYHRFDENGGYSTSSEQFETHLKAIKDSGVKVQTVSQAADSINR